jgi:hypothetical protein
MFDLIRNYNYKYLLKKGGQCIFDGKIAKCVCKENYTGNLCDVENPIKLTAPNRQTKYDFTSCDDLRCANGGTCKQIESNEVKCFCRRKYAGKFCQKKVFSQFKSYFTYGEECSDNENSLCDFTKGLICNNEKSSCNCPLKLDKYKCDCPIDKFWNGFSCGLFN